MCESSIWVRHPGGRAEKIADHILIAQQDGPNVILRGLLSEPLRVAGAIQEIDSLKYAISLIVTGAAEVNDRVAPAQVHEPVRTLPEADNLPAPDLHSSHSHGHSRAGSIVVEWQSTRT